MSVVEKISRTEDLRSSIVLRIRGKFGRIHGQGQLCTQPGRCSTTKADARWVAAAEFKTVTRRRFRLREADGG